MAIAGSPEERSVTILVFRLDVRVPIQEETYDIRVASPSSQGEWYADVRVVHVHLINREHRVAVIVLRLDVCAPIQEEFHDSRVAIAGS